MSPLALAPSSESSSLSHTSLRNSLPVGAVRVISATAEAINQSMYETPRAVRTNDVEAFKIKPGTRYVDGLELVAQRIIADMQLGKSVPLLQELARSHLPN